MNAAIAHARETLPGFWKEFQNPKPSDHFNLKVKITDSNGTEYFWAGSLQRRGSAITGVIDNDPNIVRSVKLGQRINIPDADIADWLYMRDGKMHGNYTLRAMFKHMSADEVAQAKKMLADD